MVHVRAPPSNGLEGISGYFNGDLMPRPRLSPPSVSVFKQWLINSLN